jgi:anti-sigma-K factor RskA
LAWNGRRERALNLWYVSEGKKAVSVGLGGEGGIYLKNIKNIKTSDGDMLAISEEPAGGLSPE